jgi:hypothetical protein
VNRVVVIVAVVGALALALAGFLSSPTTKTVTATVVAPPTSRQQGAPVVVTIDPAHEDGLTPAQKIFRGAGASGCGTERAGVKHLTDGFALPADGVVMTPDQLVAMAAPPVTQDSPRFPVEQQLLVLENVHVIAAKQEADSDLHVIIATPTGAELNVEAPQAQCDESSPYAGVLAQARAAMDQAMPSISGAHYTPLDLRATIEGVLFFDVLHGQRGAPNGVELHPVTFFSTTGGPPPPITTTTVPTTTASTTTVPTQTVLTRTVVTTAVVTRTVVTTTVITTTEPTTTVITTTEPISTVPTSTVGGPTTLVATTRGPTTTG